METENPEDSFLTLEVVEKAEIARDIWHFSLARPGGGKLPGYPPGSHLTVITPSAARRQYSLCGNGIDPDVYELAIKSEAEGRGASLSMVNGLAAGDRIRVSLPENSFELVPAQEYLFIAGGIGITPVLSMLRYLAANDQTDFQLIYLTRDAAGTAFAEQLRSAPFADRVTLHHDDGDPDRIYDLWPHFETPGKAQVYCCGPRPLMEEVGDMTGHWRQGSIHFEDFASGQGAPRADDRPFTVVHADSGERVEVAADATILESLRGRGFDMRSSCESGTCGACRLELVSGRADHRDIVLEDRDRDRFIMVCVSRAMDDELVLRW